MQPATTQDIEYASLGYRFLAVLIDMAVIMGGFFVAGMVWAIVLLGQGRLDPSDPAAAQRLAEDITGTSDLAINVIYFGALFIYYTVCEGLLGASLGKLACHMRVVMADGSRPTGLAIVVRNLIRIPEVWLLYIPAGISCLATGRRQRLGDLAARTVVVRRSTRAVAVGPPPLTGSRAPHASPYTSYPGSQAPPAYGPPAPPAGGGPPTGGPPAAGPAAWPPGTAAPEAPPAPPAPGGGWEEQAIVPASDLPTALDAALSTLKTAALAVRGAHLGYLHFSERELSAQSVGATETVGSAQGAGPAENAVLTDDVDAVDKADTAESYSKEYVGAWFTLADAVVAFQEARDQASVAAAATGRTLEDACAPQADLAHLLRGLTPYTMAATDEQIHEAFLAVARAELPRP